MKTAQEAIKDLEQRESALLVELSQVRSAIRELQISLCPIKVGDVVRYDRDGKEYRVIEVDRPEWGWVYANPKKADGSWGAVKRHLIGTCTPVTNGDRKGET